MDDDNANKLLNAMKYELKSMKQNEVWDLVDFPEDSKTVGCKWVFETKRDSYGNLERYKIHTVMMDKSWIEKPIRSKEFLDGVVQFLDFAFSNVPINDQIPCPCITCGFLKMGNRIEVFSHLLQKGFPRKYTFWYMHGEKHVQDNVETIAQPQEEWVRQYPMQDMLDDVFGIFDDSGIQDSGHSNIPNDDQPRGDASKVQQEKIKEQLGDGNEELYPGCKKYSKISFIVLLYHIKVLCSATDKTFSMIIDLLNDAFPHAKLPASLYEAKKLIKKLGLSYEKIHACPNNCMLYWGSLEDKKRDNCKICNASRWKSNGNISGANDIVVGQNKKYIPAKVLRAFEMAWKEFDKMYPDFALDSRNIRLALATDGFNPFGTLSSNNSIWPVMLYAYNYPPWYCMKQTSLIMSMIIPGPKMPGNSIDVYLQPLVSELQKLWKGVEAYDSSTKESFQMRASLFCTISDFPGLDNLSGWNTHTSLACPSCNFDTESKWLKFGGKYCFMGHRRYLPLDHN
ncbi:PREDICTED: uncharacterized protein LOC109344705 [Lupinus angustifolius]|uniref:uncharacterized protein LOC109344705 n=1 Tax=Lupinus angustifolius TaxID=3871 RepID=UPI00092F1817|nr:PREDICTED: uncharacterized protein LOC109344705 [Lupinus angustifolius]